MKNGFEERETRISENSQRVFAFHSKGLGLHHFTQTALSRSPMTCTMAQSSLPLPRCTFCTGLPRHWALFFLRCWEVILSLHLLVSTLLPSLFIMEHSRARSLILFPLLSFLVITSRLMTSIAFYINLEITQMSINVRANAYIGMRTQQNITQQSNELQ